MFRLPHQLPISSLAVRPKAIDDKAMGFQPLQAVMAFMATV